MGKLLYRRLGALGASPLLPLGLGDDQHRAGYDAALDAWLPQLWTALRARFPLPPDAPPEPAPSDVSALLHPKYTVVQLSEAPLNVLTYGNLYEEAVAAAAAVDALDAAASGVGPSPHAPGHPAGTAEAAVNGQTRYTAAAPLFTVVAGNRRVTAPDHFQDVRMIELDLSGSGMTYEPGDVIAVWPQQAEEVVHAFCVRCGLDANAWVEISALGAPGAAENGGVDGLKANTSTHKVILRVGAVIAGVLDVAAAVPRRSFFQALAQHCPPGLHADRLASFASPSGRDDCHEYCRRERRGVLEVLEDFPPASLPLAWALSYAPRLRPRRFSVASSLDLHPNAAQLLVAVVEYATPGRRRRRGLCSAWLAGLPAGARVAAWPERGALRPPADPSTPCIFIGPGTGVAPFRSFLQARQAAARAPGAAPPAPWLLVFGCRHESGDFYCREEWEQMQKEEVLGGSTGGLLTAFSRDGPSKVYVQHKVKERAAEVWAMLQAGASVFVAGSADRMPADVEAAVRVVVETAGGMGAEEAQRFVKRLKATGRYQVECWS
jgi:sulfite reductase alpha subunit-like flavoprotein